MKRKVAPKSLVLSEDRDGSVASLAAAIAWSSLDYQTRNKFEQQAREAISILRRQARGRR